MEELQNNLKRLRLSGIAKILPIRYQEAKANDLDYIEFLERIINDELERRKKNQREFYPNT